MESAMEKVKGIGGLFLHARDPEALGKLYRDPLRITLVSSNDDELPWRQEAGPTAFAPFPEATDYFGEAYGAHHVPKNGCVAENGARKGAQAMDLTGLTRQSSICRT
jgi:hypothetical protein